MGNLIKLLTATLFTALAVGFIGFLVGVFIAATIVPINFVLEYL